ncbi:MAG: hypothetical protein FIA95_06060 [Gemmatimonadetes bacterium]|nr:hypothetical protein [Gemmatimonadota bacterium]
MMSQPPVRRLFPLLALALLLDGCEEDVVRPGGDVVALIAVDPMAPHLGVMEQLQLTAVARNASGLPVPALITWSSAAPTVASVDSLGVLTAHSEGTTAVTARLARSQGEGRIRAWSTPAAVQAVSDRLGFHW